MTAYIGSALVHVCVCRTVRESTILYAPGECILDESASACFILDESASACFILDESASACFIFEPVEITEKKC